MATVFDGTNYYEWRVAIKLFSKAKRIGGFSLWSVIECDPYALRKEKSKSGEYIKRCKEQEEVVDNAIFRISESLKSKYQSQISDCKSAKEDWIKLKDIFMKNDITNMTLARQKLYSMKLIDESKLLDFICELEDLQRQLEHSSAPVCDAESHWDTIICITGKLVVICKWIEM